MVILQGSGSPDQTDFGQIQDVQLSTQTEVGGKASTRSALKFYLVANFLIFRSSLDGCSSFLSKPR